MSRRHVWVLVGLVVALAALTSGPSALALSQAGSGLTFTPSPAKAGQGVTTSVDLAVADRRFDAKGARCAVAWDGTDIVTPQPTCSLEDPRAPSSTSVSSCPRPPRPALTRSW
jgi:hypothetical protein